MPGLNLTRAEAEQRAAAVHDVRSYAVELDLTRGERVFGSKTTVRFTAEAEASTFIDAITDTVRSVVLNGRELSVDDVADGVRIQLPQLQEVNELVVDADMLYMNTGEGLHRFVDPVDGEVYLYTQFEVPDSRRMFAVFEQPDLKSEFAFTVTAPGHWEVISNEPTPMPTDAPGAGVTGAKTWAFPATPRMSSYITALIAGPYKGTHSTLTSSSGRTIDLGVYTRASMFEHMDAENVFELTRQGFAFYEEQFGTPYPFTKYDQLFVPDFNAGAMENAGAVTYLESYVFRSRANEAVIERRAVTILHELAHMWFGDLVTMKWWNDLWLNESFAEFMCHLSAAETTEFTEAWTTFSATDKWWAYNQDQLPTTHPIVAEIRDLDDVQVNFDGITYAKGASVLRQLVAWVGQEKFMEGVRRYFEKHAWGNTVLEDLMVELEAASGRDLASWGRIWLQTAGVNTLSAEFGIADGAYRNVSIVQTAPENYPTLRPHRMGLGVYSLDGDAVRLVKRVELDVDGARTAVPELEGAAAGDLLLVNDGDLAYGKIRLDEASLAFAIENLSRIEDPLARALVWGATWDGTRDAELDPRDFIALVSNNIAAESNPSVAQAVLRNVSAALLRYVPESARPEQGRQLSAALMRGVQEAESGSDMQFQLLQALAAVAFDEESLAFLRGLYDGGEQLEGITADAGLKWTLLKALVAAGAAGEAEIAAMEQEDATASGAMEAEAARASVQGEAARQRTFERLFSERSIPNLTLRNAAAGFQRGLGSEDLAGFVDAYFEQVEAIRGVLSHEVRQSLVMGLFPQRVIAQSTLDATDAYLEKLGDEDAGVRRMLLECRDGLRRALAVQQRWA